MIKAPELKNRVLPDRLRRECRPAVFNFETTAELVPLVGFAGQPRAMEGLEIGLLSGDKAYNICAIVDGGTSRSSALIGEIREIVNTHMSEVEVYDYCYTFNFRDSHRARPLLLKRGRGKPFQEAMKKMRGILVEEVPKAFQSAEFFQRTEEIKDPLWEVDQYIKQALIDAVPENLREHVLLRKVGLGEGEEGVYVLPQVGNQQWLLHHRIVSIGPGPKPDFYVIRPGDSDEYIESLNADIPEDEKSALKASIDSLQDEFRKRDGEFKRIEEEVSREIEKLQDHIISQVLDRAFKGVFEEYPEAQEFLAGLRNFVHSEYSIFFPHQPGQTPVIPGTRMDKFKVFDVNVLVDNSDLSSAPVVLEDDPTFANLFGRIVRSGIAMMPDGTPSRDSTDHTSIQAGSLLKANGGVLIFSLADLMLSPGAPGNTWRLLINALHKKELAIEDLADRSGYFPMGNFKPGPVPLNVKVVLITDRHWDTIVSQLFPADYDLFRAKAEFVSTTVRTRRNELELARFLARCSKKEGLPHATREAVAAIVEYASRLAEDRRKLSLNFNKVKDVLLQAVYWARKRDANAMEATADDVQKALEHHAYRSDAVMQRMIELRRDGVFKVDIKGKRVGRTNALSVYPLGDFAFGMPTVVSAATSLGKYDVVNIERKIEMGGPLQQKSVDVISGFFRRRFGREMPLAMNAQIVFEQNYGGVDGDSASLAEFIALISDLTDIPVLQNVAITGSCSQHGDAQAIGGVNLKIEGFFDVCRAVGNGKLTGDQGVIIPRDNLNNLMLREDIVQAARENKFRVVAVSTIDEAMEAAMGMKADAINERVREVLRDFASKAREWSSPRREQDTSKSS